MMENHAGNGVGNAARALLGCKKGDCKGTVTGTSGWDGKPRPKDKGELTRSSLLALSSPMNPTLAQRTRKAQVQHIPQHLPKYPFSPALAAMDAG